MFESIRVHLTQPHLFLTRFSRTIAFWVMLGWCLMGWTPSAQAAVVYFMIDGSGENEDFGTHRWKVEYDAAMSVSGYDLFEAVFGPAESLGAGSYRLGSASGNHVLMMNYGSEQDPNYFITSMTMNGVTLANTVTPPWVPLWTQFVEGGSYGYPYAEPDQDIGEWDLGGGISAPYRYLQDGSFEAFLYGAYTTPDGDITMPTAPPSVNDFAQAPTVYLLIPEPGAWMLLGVGLVAVGLRRRRTGYGDCGCNGIGEK